MNNVHAYCRVSTQTQNVERQQRSILQKYPEAVFHCEKFTGTKLDRPVFQRMLKQLKSGDVLVFDSVDRMARNSSEGTKVYFDLVERGIELHFIKQPHIDSTVYMAALEKAVPMVGEAVDCILRGVNEYLRELARQQIALAFTAAENEVNTLHERVSAGMETAKMHGKQIGQRQGAVLNVKKRNQSIEIIKTHSKSFGGSLSDSECMKLCGCSRNSFYAYKRMAAEAAE